MKTITRTFYIDFDGKEHRTPEACAASMCRDESAIGRQLTEFEEDVLELYQKEPAKFRAIVEIAEEYTRNVGA